MTFDHVAESPVWVHLATSVSSSWVGTELVKAQRTLVISHAIEHEAMKCTFNRSEESARWMKVTAPNRCPSNRGRSRRRLDLAALRRIRRVARTVADLKRDPAAPVDVDAIMLAERLRAFPVGPVRVASRK